MLVMRARSTLVSDSSAHRGGDEMEIMVLYYSETGNTRAIAEAVMDELVSLGHEVAFKRTSDVESGGLSGFDMVFVGRRAIAQMWHVP